jgi:glutamate formiminotransferase
MCLQAHGRAQLSMSITDYEVTPISHVFKTVTHLAHKHKVVPVEGEVIGLIPQAACERDTEWLRQLVGFDPQTKVLEHRLAAPLRWPGDR